MKYLFCTLLFILPLALCADDYIVNVNSGLIVREQPSPSSRSIGSLDNGQRIAVYDIDNGWAHIDHNGNDGYVSTAYISPLSDETAGLADATPSPPSEAAKPLLIIIFFIALLGRIICFRQGYVSFAFWFIMIMSVLELVYIFGFSEGLFPEKTGIWFCDPEVVGWGWTIANLVLFLFVAAAQFGLLTLADRALNIDGVFPTAIAKYAWTGLVAGVIITMVNDWMEVAIWIFWLFILAMTVCCILISLKKGVAAGTKVRLILLWLVGPFALLAASVYSLWLLLIVAALWVIIQIAKHSRYVHYR